MFNVISRREWGADRARWGVVLDHPATNVFTTFDIHIGPCYSKKKCINDVKFLQKETTRTRQVPDIKYNFLVTARGYIIEGRGWLYVPGLPVRYKEFGASSIYIGLMGNFNRGEPPKCMYESRDYIIEFGLKKGYISKKCLEFNLKFN